MTGSSCYWQKAWDVYLNLEQMGLTERQYMETPFYGVPGMNTRLCWIFEYIFGVFACSMGAI